jgi:acyl carrier protein
MEGPMSDKLISLFAEELGVDPDALNEESSPENTPEWDSLAAMNLVAAVEDTFDTTLSTKEIMVMRSIGIVRRVLTEKGVDL